IEFLNAVVAQVGHVDVTGGVRRDAIRAVELPIPAAERAPLTQVRTRVTELLDAVVVLIRDIDVARDIHCHAMRTVELPIAAAERAPLKEVDWRLGAGNRGYECREDEHR